MEFLKKILNNIKEYAAFFASVALLFVTYMVFFRKNKIDKVMEDVKGKRKQFRKKVKGYEKTVKHNDKWLSDNKLK